MKKFVFTLLSLCATTAFAQSDAFVVGDFNLAPGQTKEMTISLENAEKAYTAFQFDLTLPEGVTIAKENDDFKASLVGERKDDHVLVVGDVGSNTYRFLCYSMTNANIKGTTGALITVALTAGAEAELGKKDVDLKAALIVTAEAASTVPDDSKTSLTVGFGDANNDGEVNVADLAAIVNCILDKAPEGYDKNMADINGDGDVNVADIAAEVNVLLYGTVTPPAKARQASQELDPQ